MNRPIRRRFATLGMLATAALGLALAVAGPAAAFPPPITYAPNGPVHSQANGHCLDGDAAHLGTPGDKVQLWTCSGANNQNWLWTRAHDGVLLNETGATAQCLDLDPSTHMANGTLVRLEPCSPNSASQTWIAYGGGGAVINAAANRCLDADAGGINTNGDKIQIWDCTMAPNQLWTFTYPNS